MKHKIILLLAIAMAWNTLSAQEIAPVEAVVPETPQKGSMALSIQLGRASVNRLSTLGGNSVLTVGLTQSIGVGLHFIRPNATRHIVSLDWYSEGSTIGFSPSTSPFGTNRGGYIGYEFRKYFPMGASKWQWYLGAWAQTQGTVAFVANGPNMAFARANAGVSAGVQYDIRSRFFLDGGLRLGVLSTEYSRDAFLGNQSQIGTGRYLLDAKVGVGYRF